MNKEVKYYSDDKLYRVSGRKKLKIKGWLLILLIPSILLLMSSVLLLFSSLEMNTKKINVGYSEKGNVDYKVYLKENNYYNRKFLNSGMKYVASIINSINSKFNYEIYASDNMDFKYTYKITGDLIITDPVDENKVLYTKNVILKDEKTEEINSNSIVINEDVDIDYDEYNNYVNAYKKEYGLAVNSKLLLSMNVNVEGNHAGSDEKLNRKQDLQISIPLSEQTIDINILSDRINESGNLSSNIDTNIKNKFLFMMSLLVMVIALTGIIVSFYLLIQYRKKNIYNITVNKLLREYDRVIVSGETDIDEKKYSNKVYAKSFSEMVDASQTLNSPILYYEVIPNEKCFFVIIKDDTIYKYRLTRAYLERNGVE